MTKANQLANELIRVLGLYWAGRGKAEFEVFSARYLTAAGERVANEMDNLAGGQEQFADAMRAVTA